MLGSFTTSFMGSLPRPKDVMRAQRRHRKGAMGDAEFAQLIAERTREVVESQDRAGLDLIVSGELARDSYVSFISEKIAGTTRMTMLDMLAYLEDKDAFEEMLTTLDVPASGIANAICTGPLSCERGIALDELELVRRFTDKPVKVTLPGPYLVTRSMWLAEVSRPAYASKEELGEAVIGIMREEVARLAAAGAAVIQFDEPVLTEVVFTPGKTRTFMCAALAEKKDPAEELEFATHLIGSVLGAVDRSRTKACLHICRGNWSRDESILLTGPYTPLVPLMEAVCPDVLFLEYSTPRAGELSSLLSSAVIRERCVLGLGVENPRTAEVESVESIVARAEEALRWLPPEQLWLNPDCGFATFANRPVSEAGTIARKAEALVEAARILRQRHGC